MTDADENEPTPIEEAAGEQLGVESWDRPAIFRETAHAAIDNGLPYWLILILSGSIATLGLALDSSAVVIGAMLVAPLLAPVVGLAMSLAVGDGRLAVQTALVVIGSTLAVIVVAALLTLLLPFQNITVEISARTRPTTLDLAIAILSGLVGAVVTVARGSRLSAAIPGVAISVALIPPLAVAGFGIGIGWNAALIRGSLLLYGANLAGIVLSGMAVFLLVGMQRGPVVEEARRWRERVQPHGLAGWADRFAWVRSLGVFSSARGRIGMVAAFAVALGIPLSETLAQIAREARVERAVEQVGSSLFAVEGRVSILSRQVVYGASDARVYLRVATTDWLGEELRSEFERTASSRAGEPIRLTLEQIPARGEEVEQIASRLASEPAAPVRARPAASAPLPELLATAGERLQSLAGSVALPDDVWLARVELATTAAGRSVVRVIYASSSPLPEEAEEMIARQVGAQLDLPGASVRISRISAEEYPLGGDAADSVVLESVAEALAASPAAGVEISGPAGEEGEDGAVERVRRWFLTHEIEAERIRTVVDTAGGPRLRIVPEGP